MIPGMINRKGSLINKKSTSADGRGFVESSVPRSDKNQTCGVLGCLSALEGQSKNNNAKPSKDKGISVGGPLNGWVKRGNMGAMDLFLFFFREFWELSHFGNVQPQVWEPGE